MTPKDLPPSEDTTSNSALGARELFLQVRNQLSSEDLYVAEQRAAGRDWADLAAELGTTPQALRRRLARALHAARQ
jgi:RNA polymerase sigma-70 factor (ECF subfamily)